MELGIPGDLFLPGIMKFDGPRLFVVGGSIVGGANSDGKFDVVGPLEGAWEFLKTSTTPLLLVIPPAI